MGNGEQGMGDERWELLHTTLTRLLCFDAMV